MQELKTEQEKVFYEVVSQILKYVEHTDKHATQIQTNPNMKGEIIE